MKRSSRNSEKISHSKTIPMIASQNRNNAWMIPQYAYFYALLLVKAMANDVASKILNLKHN